MSIMPRCSATELCFWNCRCVENEGSIFCYQHYCNGNCQGRSIGSNLAKFSTVVNAQRSVIVQQFFRNVMVIFSSWFRKRDGHGSLPIVEIVGIAYSYLKSSGILESFKGSMPALPCFVWATMPEFDACRCAALNEQQRQGLMPAAAQDYMSNNARAWCLPLRNFEVQVLAMAQHEVEAH